MKEVMRKSGWFHLNVLMTNFAYLCHSPAKLCAFYAHLFNDIQVYEKLIDNILHVGMWHFL